MLDLRDAFFVPGDAVELRAFTHGLMPRTVPAMMERFTEDWRRLGVDAWNAVPNHWRPHSGEAVGWWTLPEYLGDHFIAPLLGAPRGTCIMQPSVHWTMQCLLSAPELFSEGVEVVLTEAEFPSTLHSAQRWADILGFDVRVVPLNEDGFVDEEGVLEAISPDAALVVLSHVGFTTGEKLTDVFLEQVAEAAHEHGALFALDGYHANGSMPIDVGALGADVYLGGLLKEACGSSGNAFVYVAPDVELTPRVGGWFGDERPFAFEPEPQPHPDVRRRFLGGTTAVASLYHAVEGVRLLLEAGLADVRADSLAKTDLALRRADEAGLALRSPRESERRSAMVILDVPSADKLCAHLKRQHIYTDSRQGRYLRLAPFVWNTMEEIERTFDAIAEAVTSGAYLRLDETALDRAGPVT